jgi:hypothetical protein
VQSLCYYIDINKKTAIEGENKMIKEKSKVEKSIERKMKAKGFNITMLKQYISKTVYVISKDGIEQKVEVPSNVTDTTLYANMLSELFKVSAEING